jgi:hypothetical protein
MFHKFLRFLKNSTENYHTEIMQEVLKTAKNVAEISRCVWIDKQALLRFSRKLIEGRIEVPPWNSLYHFSGKAEDMVSYLLVLDSLNFCFWPAPEKVRWEIEYESKRLSGYYALAISLKRCIESGIPITRADYLAELTSGTLQQILGGMGELQLMENRAQILNELGRLLVEEYDGEAYRLIEAAESSAVKLVILLVEKLTSFQDVAEYAGHKVFFYKRAQISVADLYGAFDGKDYGNFKDIDRLTAFADYKLPQVLRHLGILRYERSLEEKVAQRILIVAGNPEEVEIRANTIWAVELIRQELRRMGRNLRAFEIDWILWNLGQKREFKASPYHRTKTIFY